ncbi:hypothetical protein N7517_010321 [Penicillium concentricum]|uniref:Uncharacterized protein n=1 Tax=Penicillium concentricum TaxID=293559 RepID=A0A9W9R8K4_9EURO|nr:uncharacterized protein N7517_010321 [Penicillium concentricum]KAJ5355712.1 hypothetical protein N7517_010321 [Penicillium concentricum]
MNCFLSPCKSELRRVLPKGRSHYPGGNELVTYEKLGVENHVRNIISELCSRPEARQHFRLGKGVSFESHTNSFEAGPRDDPSQRPRPDRFCIHHKLDGSSDVLMTVEYKPPHKLTVENSEWACGQ